jgi:hypothetical protein
MATKNVQKWQGNCLEALEFCLFVLEPEDSHQTEDNRRMNQYKVLLC